MTGAPGAPDGRTSCSIRSGSRGIGWRTSRRGAVAAGRRPSGQRPHADLVRNDQPVPEKLPVEIREYLAATPAACPEWADTAKIKRGQQLFETWGLLIILCLFCASLPSAYAAAKGVKVLYSTAQLETDTRRRMMETGQFLMDVLAVGSFETTGKGFRTIAHVRLMHAAVRKMIKGRKVQHPGLWDPNWGIPINQEDLAGTMLSFSYVPVEPLRRLGVRCPTRMPRPTCICGTSSPTCSDWTTNCAWAVSTMPTNWSTTIRRRQFRASPEGQEMTAALMELLDEMTPCADSTNRSRR